MLPVCKRVKLSLNYYGHMENTAGHRLHSFYGKLLDGSRGNLEYSGNCPCVKHNFTRKNAGVLAVHLLFVPVLDTIHQKNYMCTDGWMLLCALRYSKPNELCATQGRCCGKIASDSESWRGNCVQHRDHNIWTTRTPSNDTMSLTAWPIDENGGMDFEDDGICDQPQE